MLSPKSMVKLPPCLIKPGFNSLICIEKGPALTRLSSTLPHLLLLANSRVQEAGAENGVCCAEMSQCHGVQCVGVCYRTGARGSEE